jgi:2-hydroxyacyl-CoA lyase 1
MSYSIHAEYSRWDEADDRLVIVGKGIAWSRAEDEVRTFIEGTQIPFLGSPMGKGVMPNLRIA